MTSETNQGQISVVYIPTASQQLDILTKNHKGEFNLTH